MTVLVIVAVVLLAIVAMAFLMRGKTRSAGDRDKIWRRRLLSKNEQPMYFRLRETFPDHVVLVQVAFSSLLNSRSKGTQSTFDRRVADFLLWPAQRAYQVDHEQQHAASEDEGAHG